MFFFALAFLFRAIWQWPGVVWDIETRKEWGVKGLPATPQSEALRSFPEGVAMAKEFPKVWKDCVLRLLNEGVDGYPNRGKWNKSNQKEAAIYISMEARRLGYSSAKTMDMILEWNRKKNHPSVAKTKILTDVVSYIFEQNPPPERGCKGELVKKGYCLLNRGQQCQYWEQLTSRQMGYKRF